MENKNEKNHKFLKILTILIFVIAIAVIITYIIEYSEMKKSYSELKIKYEEVSRKLELYENDFEKNKKAEQITVEKEIDNTLKDDRITENIQPGNLDINSEIVQNLYSKILKSNKISYDFEGSFYKDEKTTIDNLTNEEKVLAIVQNLEEKDYTEFNNLNKEIKEELLKRVGKKYQYEIEMTKGYQYVRYLTIYSEEELIKKAKEIFGSNINVNFANFDNAMDQYWEYIDGDYYSFSGLRRWRIWTT